MTAAHTGKKRDRARAGKTGPEREWQGDDRESVVNPSRARESEQKENDLGDRAGMPDTPRPDTPSKSTPDSGASPAAPTRNAGVERESA